MTTATRKPEIPTEATSITSTTWLWQPLLIAGTTALFASLVVGYLTSDGISRWFHSYLLAVCFFLSISLGALFFVTLHHLTNARWSIVTRRIAEVLTSSLPALALMLLPIVVPMLFGSSLMYRWNDATLRATDELLQSKAVYLNAPFFAIRCMVYFGVWIFCAGFFRRLSLQQDTLQNSAPGKRMRRYSGPAMLAFAITVNFAAFDWLMSLDPHWFSAILGIYFFAGLRSRILRLAAHRLRRVTAEWAIA